MAEKSNKEELIDLLWTDGNTEEQIAYLMDIDPDEIHKYLYREGKR